MITERSGRTALRYLDATKPSRFRAATFAIILIISLPQTRAASANDHACERFQANMTAAAAVAAGLGSEAYLENEILGIEEFAPYIGNPEPHSECAKTFIVSDKGDLNARIMAALSIQARPQDRLFPILDSIVQAAIDGKLNRQKSAVFDSGILMAALFPPPNFNAYLDFFYEDPRSKALLANAQRIPDLEPDLGERIREALSGAGQDQHFELIDTGQTIREDYRVDGRSVSVNDLIESRP